MAQPRIASKPLSRSLRGSSWLTRWTMILIGSAYLVILVGLPVVAIFHEAFAKGATKYWEAISSKDTLSAISLTLQVVAISVPLNVLFGVAASWALTKFQVRFRTLVLTIIDLPLCVSPVIAGLVFILLFGSKGWFAPALEFFDFQIIFAKPGIFLVTIFITLPFVVRELVPLMQALGRDKEEAAYVLCASGWQIFWRITLPSIKSGLLYGVILCQARAIGEFGAASVVSGSLRGKTVTLPLQIDALFSDYQAAASFACATLLTLTAFATVALKTWLERGEKRAHARQAANL